MHFQTKLFYYAHVKYIAYALMKKYLNSIERPRYASVIVNDKTAVGVSTLRCSEDKNALLQYNKLNAKYKNPKLYDVYENILC